MKEYIKKIQSKPEPVRKQILIGSLVVCMSLVCLIWISSLGYRLFDNGTKVAETKEAMKPFALFGQTVSDTYKNISASVGSLPSEDQNKEADSKEENVVEMNQIDLIPVENQTQQ